MTKWTGSSPERGISHARGAEDLNVVHAEAEGIIRHTLGLSTDTRVVYTDEGWDSRVYLVNRGEAVFKFARSDLIAQQYEREIAALQLMEAMELPVLTPRLRWQGPNLSYLGYEGIVGEPLRAVLPSLNERTRKRIGATIGQFLSCLHQATLDAAPTMTVEDEIVTYQMRYGLSASALEELSRRERAVLAEFFERELPHELGRLGGELLLGHGDLGPWNVVIANSGKVGIVDFADVVYEDPSRDFSGNFGDPVLEAAALEAYGATEHLRRKAAIRKRALPVLDLPYYIGKGDGVGISTCLQQIRRLILESSGTSSCYPR